MEKLGWISIYQKHFGKAPQYTYLRKFGCLCFATKLKPNKDKFENRSTKAILIGYDGNHKVYKLYDNDHTIFMSRDVIFHEHIFPFKDSYNEYNIILPLPIIELNLETLKPLTSLSTSVSNSLPEPRRSTKLTKPPSWLQDFIHTASTTTNSASPSISFTPSHHSFLSNVSHIIEPHTYV